MTDGSADGEKFVFNVGDTEYVIWAWKGDYINLGAGAEVGIYKESGVPGHYLTAPELAMPMTLKLEYKNTHEVYFDWKPRKDQWWIGPAIAAADYEVTSEVRERLLERPAVNSSCFTSTAPGHHLANLALAATLILKHAGLKSQSISHCTLSTKTDLRLHSHRRDGQDSGRMATVVGITA